MWLTQPVPRAWRPSTRATVVGSPRRTATRRSGPNDLAIGAHHGPARPAPADAVVGGTGHRSGVVVLHHHGGGMTGQHQAQGPGPLGVEGGAGGVVGPRRHHHGPGSGVQRHGQGIGPHPPGVDGNGNGLEAQGRQEVEHAGVPGVLHRHPVTGPEVGGQDPFDTVHGAADDGQRAGGDTVGVELAGGGGHQAGVLDRVPVEPGRQVKGAEHRGEIGEEGGVGVPVGQVPDAGGHDEAGPDGQGRPSGHHRAPAALAHQEAAVGQALVGGGHRARTDLQAGGEGPDGRKPFSGLEASVPDGAFDVDGNRLGRGAFGMILYRHGRQIVPVHNALMQPMFSTEREVVWCRRRFGAPSGVAPSGGATSGRRWRRSSTRAWWPMSAWPSTASRS